MKQKTLLAMLVLIVLIGFPSFVAARMVHDFDCDNCHKPGMALASVSGIVCLDCHTSGMVGSNFPLERTGPGNTNPISSSTFAVGDASDALGSVAAQSETAGDQTSHNWASLLENAAAGANRPSNSKFFGRQNSSGSYLTCSRCHDPHADSEATRWGPANPKLLKTGADTESAMCNDCHVSWASDTAPSEGGGAPTNVHPMVTNYAAIATAKSLEYNSVVELNATAGEVALNATGGIDCLSCHGVHFTDSNSATADGVQAGSLGHLNPGGTSQGKILKANGPAFDQAGVAGDSICQSCHKYGEHGSKRSNPIGCLVCHGAHLEDVGGLMNNYMLRTSITTKLPNAAGNGTVAGLTLDIGTDPSVRLWNYCFSCHDSAAASISHDSGWTCSDCHSHGDNNGSWTASGACNTCHGFPPSVDLKSDGAGGNTGYANGYELTNHFKNEGATLHSLHTGGSIRYSFSCNSCHAGNGHIDGSFDDVFLDTGSQIYNGNGAITASYVPGLTANADKGTCSSVYCHSNGGPRGTAPTPSDPGVWEGGAVTGPNNCSICHGNNVATMGTRSNSATHIAHLNKGYSCQVCHTDTADSATTLAAGAIGGTHVDGVADVAFDATSLSFALGSTSYGTDGTCSVYCHSNGTTNISPDWDLDTSGACGSCHQYNNAGATGSGTALGGAHDVHVYATSGPQLACSICHGHDGEVGLSNSLHVNGTVDKVTNYMDAVCNPCHGSVNGGGVNDTEPVWVTPASVSCQTCHAGSVIATIGGNGGSGTYVDKGSYPTYGHGKSGIDAGCESCHNAAAAGHFNGNNDPRLKDQNSKAFADDANVWCQDCHATTMAHFTAANGSLGANLCQTCHNPHGEAGNTQDAMIVDSIGGFTVSGFANKGDSTSYYTGLNGGVYEGICQVCHSASIAHYSRTVAPDSHNPTGSGCVSCHPHTNAPAFKASCNGCHGDSATGQFWPFGSGGSIPTANDEVGEHSVHVLAISQQLGYGDIAALLAAADTDSKQKAICEYCHAATTNDSDHGLIAGLDADVFVDKDNARHAKFLDGTDDLNAAYVAGTCNTVACHNGKSTDTADGTFNWTTGVNDPGCILCHNDITNTGIATGQTHNAHTGASTLYGVSINCASCHDAATDWATKTKPASNHIDGSFNMGGTVPLTYSAGSCAINACHEDGKGGATPAYTWGTAGTSDCGICHSASPTTGAHAAHISDANGPTLGTDCAACHKAVSNASMAGMTTHINTTVTLNTVADVAYEVVGSIGQVANDGVDSCNLCHGGTTPALTAKDNWAASTEVSCESCHGDYTAAVIGGVTAPTRAGTAWDNTGHGKYPAFPKCNFCHLKNSAHISGGLNDDNRLLVPGADDYEILGERNGYCNTCHATTMNVHFGDDNIAGGGSTDGLYCVTCHDPHGQDGFDAMIKAKVGGATTAPGTQTVAGFTNRNDRTKYRDASFTGVCQTCHASSEVDYFNQDTEDANDTHNPDVNCISCHPHTAAPAFKASCYACHGDETSGQFWPNGSGGGIPDANDNAGRHDEHVLLIGQQLGYGDYNPTMYTDDEQKAICAYCHAVNDDDHGLLASLPAEVFKATVATVTNTVVAKVIWDAGDDANATFTKGDGSCATVDCHNNKTTTIAGPNDYSWGGSDTSTCVMCHVDVPADTASHTIHTGGNFNFACSVCHAGTPTWDDGANGTQSAPSTGHMNGISAISGGSRTFTYSSGTGSCATNECHNDGNMGAPIISGYDWSVGKTAGVCGACHGFSMVSNNHETHYKAHATGNGTERFMQSTISCADCHTYADHLSGAINFKVGISYSGDTDIDVAANFGSCDTLLCHSNGRGSTVVTPLWTRAQTAADDCTLCHADSSPGMSNAHDTHTGSNGATTYLTNNGNQSTSTEYRFDCGECHGNIIGNHLDGDTDVSVASWNGTTCTNNSCHTDGTGAANLAANWTTGWVSELDSDSCNNCHANAPNSGAHSAHAVGIHADDIDDVDGTIEGIYTGTTGNLASSGSSPSAHGDGTTSTVLSCLTCHFSTVNVWYNALNSDCSNCHDTSGTGLGNNAMTVADKSKHVDGITDVVFQNIAFKSKAQIREDITAITELDSNWDRGGRGYKLAGSYDQAKSPLSDDDYTDSTCTVSCHNSVDITWVAPTGDCSVCHTSLPK